jgi:signal transduction histidine kinase
MPTRSQALGIGLVAAGLVVLLWISGLWFGGELGWPVVLAAIGFAILWARSGDEGRPRWTLSSLGTPLGSVVGGQVSLPRLAIGSILILAGMGVFLATNTSLAAAGNMLLAMIVAIGGAALLAGPWVWSMGRELVEERSSRVRSEARAEMAAHLHDSVLQTLALIQRAKAPREMASLARTQERELRAWLYGRAPDLAGVRLRDAIDSMAGRIERQHQVSVEAVVVGDADLDDRLRGLVNACAEAVANAARHSGSTTISVYVEVEEDVVSAFVRDQGSGFDPDVVPSDRRGIAESIIGRMERRGGSAYVHSRPGGGTEVVIQLPRKAP